MKKLYIVLSICYIYTGFTTGQNLVRNFSFEDTIHCPFGYSQSTYAEGWTININSADYFHACSNTAFNAPNANFGYQCPANGNAYCGFYCFSQNNPNSHEFIGGELLNPLNSGVKYFVSLKISLPNLFKCGIDKIGIYFTNADFGDTSLSPIPIFNPQIEFPDLVYDTTNWIVLRKSFIPDSNYTFFAIGNFHNTQDNNVLCYDTVASQKVYYYIDDVCALAPKIIGHDYRKKSIILT